MATQFPQLSQLPIEIRLRIIRYAAKDAPPECCRTIWPSIDHYRQLQVHRSGVKPPAVYFVNHEFRDEPLRQQVVLAGKRINPYCDMLQLPRGRDDTATPLRPLEEILRQISIPIRQITMFVSYWDGRDDLLSAMDLRRLLPDLEVLHVMLILTKGLSRTVDAWQRQYVEATYIVRLAHSEEAFVPGIAHMHGGSWNPRLEFAVCGRKGKRGRRIMRIDA